MKRAILIFLLFLTSIDGYSQRLKKPKLLAGPVIGSVTKNSAKIWIAFRGKGNNLLILGDTAEKKVYYPTSYSYITDYKGSVALTMNFTGLKPNHRYNILISINQWGTNARYSFKTQADSAVKDFNFLLGSCALMNTDITWGVFPGISTWAFYHMRKLKSDFMVWLGDEVYYFYPKQSSSYDGMFQRQLKVRRFYKRIYRDFLANQANYAIWDDRDYGDEDKTFALKDSSLKVFKGFWPNTYPEGNQLKGNYFSFRYYDADFFMLDDRYYRDSPKDSNGSMLGETQMVWLKNKLLMSDATFKFICLGSTVLNENNFEGESYSQYPKERNSLLDFIADNNIRGVVFLTGDKHYSEVSRRNWKGYPIYDFTCSPLTSLPLPLKLFGLYYNRWRVHGTEFPFRNFGRILVTGEANNRSLKLEIHGRGGHLRRELIIDASELQRK